MSHVLIFRLAFSTQLTPKHAYDVTAAAAYAVCCVMGFEGEANIARARATVGLQEALQAARDQFEDPDSPRWSVQECAGIALDLLNSKK